jgi:Domain of unknown function (DUF1877)
MGMYLSLAGASDATIARIHADPPLIWQIVAPEDPEAVARARGPAPRPGFFARLLGREAPAPPPAPPPLELQPGEGDLGADGDLDKAWHGIHYLLTGTAWEGDPPLNFLLVGGRDVDDFETAHTFTAAETRDIAAALARVDDGELRRRFAPAEMMRLEIYPEIWDRDPAKEDPLGYLLEMTGVLRGALDRVVGQGHGLLVALT